MRKVSRVDDHLFEQMKDRIFFDAFMSEPCHRCFDLEVERDRLKADIADLSGKTGFCALCESYTREIDSLKKEFNFMMFAKDKAVNERNTWKRKAEKMAEALEYTQNKIGCIIDGSGQQRWIKIVDEALAEFEEK